MSGHIPLPIQIDEMERQSTSSHQPQPAATHNVTQQQQPVGASRNNRLNSMLEQLFREVESATANNQQNTELYQSFRERLGTALNLLNPDRLDHDVNGSDDGHSRQASESQSAAYNNANVATSSAYQQQQHGFIAIDIDQDGENVGTTPTTATVSDSGTQQSTTATAVLDEAAEIEDDDDVETQQEEAMQNDRNTQSPASPTTTARSGSRRRNRRILLGRRRHRDARDNNNGQQVAREVQDLQRLARAPEVQMMYNWMLRILPFVIVFSLKLLLDHIWRLLAIVFAVVFFIVSNVTFVNHIANNGISTGATRCKRWVQLMKAIFGPLVWLSVVLITVHDQLLWAPLVYMSAVPEHLMDDTSDVCTALFRVFMADTTAKFIGMLAKIMISQLRCIPIRRRRRVYQCIEYTFQFYRYTLPPVVWYPFLLATGHNTGWFYTTCNYALVTGYIFAKFYHGRVLVSDMCKSAQSAWSRYAYGTAPARADIDKLTNQQCSICFGDFTNPLKLSCEHVFCDDCICTWLDREHTCPICRAEVTKDDNNWKDGSTTCLVQVF